MENQSMPTDLVVEVLSRASLRTVARCRLVSKEWKDLTYQSYFMNLHSERAQVISGYFVESFIFYKHHYEFVSPTSPPNLSLGFLPGRARILASTNQGLVLCENTNPKCHRIPEFYVCKPTTKEWRHIPNPKTRYFTEAIAMVVLKSDPLRYKIIRLSEPSHLRNLNRKHANLKSLRCEIFHSDTWVWKQLEEIYLPFGEILDSHTAVSSSGIFYWLTTKKNILSFHAEEETWKTLSVPDAVKSERFKLIEYQGKLGLICNKNKKENCFQLWILKHYSGKILWEKKERISTEPIERVGRSLNIEALHNAETALIRNYSMMYFYKFADGSFDGVRLKNIYGGSQKFFPFQSDSEPCNLRKNRPIKNHRAQDQQKSTIIELGFDCGRVLGSHFVFLVFFSMLSLLSYAFAI